VQSANSQSNSISSGGTSVSSSGGGVSQSVQWFEVGQNLSVTLRWAGGQRDATVDIELQQADMAVRHNADMPTQTRQQLSTTVTAPLGQWVTIAASGAAPARAGSYSSKGSTEARRLLQVRVLAP
jgi:type II secretory pathway component GspD/PulD (secretin)